jgi:hypothetical protein
MTFGDTGVRARAASFASLCSKFSCEDGTILVIVFPVTDTPCGRGGAETPEEVEEVPICPPPLPQGVSNTKSRMHDSENHPSPSSKNLLDPEGLENEWNETITRKKSGIPI